MSLEIQNRGISGPLKGIKSIKTFKYNLQKYLIMLLNAKLKKKNS